MDDLRLIASELVTNRILRAGSTGTRAIGFTVQVTSGNIRLEATDRAPAMNGSGLPEKDEQDSDWGLLLVDRLADRWGVEPGGVVWAEIRATTTGSRRRPDWQ